MNEEANRTTEWAFYALALKLGVPVVVLTVLFLLARKGEVIALVALVAIGTVALIGLGILLTLAILDRIRKAEQLRFTENIHENLALLNTMQRIQGNQAKSLLDQNARLVRMLPDPEQKPIDVDSLTWEVYEEGEVQ